MGFLGLGKNHPQEIDTPPPSIAPPPNGPWNIGGVLSGDRRPPLYVYTQRREPVAGPTFLMAPEDNEGAARQRDLNIGWQESPDPIRSSDFYADGNKIHPTAQMMIPSHLAVASRETVMEDQFRIGKLLGYIHRPMYAGMQKPSLVRSNIQEAVPSTYGSQYEVRGVAPNSGSVTATGFAVEPTSSVMDGYPY